jgi:hypothetical protein
MLERIISAIEHALTRGGRTSAVKDPKHTIAIIFLGLMGFKFVGMPVWLIGGVALLLLIPFGLIVAVYWYGLKTKTYDLLRSEFYLLSKIAAQKESLRGDDLRTFMRTLGAEESTPLPMPPPGPPPTLPSSDEEG